MICFSVPDTDILIRIAELLDILVHNFLALKRTVDVAVDLSDKLTRLNEQLAKKTQREQLIWQAKEKRGLIFEFSFMALLMVLLAKMRSWRSYWWVYILTVVIVAYHYVSTIQGIHDAYCNVTLRHAGIITILRLRRKWDREIPFEYLMCEKPFPNCRGLPYDKDLGRTNKRLSFSIDLIKPVPAS